MSPTTDARLMFQYHQRDATFVRHLIELTFGQAQLERVALATALPVAVVRRLVVRRARAVRGELKP